MTPGDQELTITYAGLKLLTKSFTLQKGEKRTVTVSIVNKEIVARLENEILPLTSAREEKTSSPTASGKGPCSTDTRPRRQKRGCQDSAGQEEAGGRGARPPAVGPKPNVAATASKIFGRPFLVRGEWRIENDELVQPTLAAGDEISSTPRLRGGNVVELRSDPGGEKDRRTRCTGDLLPLAGTRALPRVSPRSGTSTIDFSYVYNGKWGREEGNWKGLSYSSNRWYSLKVEVRGDTFRAYLDGVLQFEQTDPRFTHGRICLFTGTRRPGFAGSRSAIRRERCCSRVCRNCRPPATTRLRKPTSAIAPAR